MGRTSSEWDAPHIGAWSTHSRSSRIANVMTTIGASPGNHGLRTVSTTRNIRSISPMLWRRRAECMHGQPGAATAATVCHEKSSLVSRSVAADNNEERGSSASGSSPIDCGRDRDRETERNGTEARTGPSAGWLTFNLGTVDARRCAPRAHSNSDYVLQDTQLESWSRFTVSSSGELQPSRPEGDPFPAIRSFFPPQCSPV